jgi:hypothetical protein
LAAQVAWVRRADETVLSVLILSQRPVLPCEVAVPAGDLREARPELGHFVLGVQDGHDPRRRSRYDTHETPRRVFAEYCRIRQVATGFGLDFVGLLID